jgi:hypothetical protein
MSDVNAPDAGNTQSTDATATAAPVVAPAAAPAAVVAAAPATAPAVDQTAAAVSTEAAPVVQSAPEAYTLKSDGVTADADVVKAFTGAAKELNLSNEGAQKLMDTIAPTVRTALAKNLEAFGEKLEAEARSDKEFGGDKFDENLAIANRAFKELGTPALRELLDKSKLGNHPELLKWAAKVGRLLGEDTHVAGGLQPTEGERKSAAEKLYGSKK